MNILPFFAVKGFGTSGLGGSKLPLLSILQPEFAGGEGGVMCRGVG